MWFGIVTLFPEMFDSLQYGITGKAFARNLIQLQFFNPREFTHDKHQTVDERPYGGGAGMVMMAEPLQATIQAARLAAPHAAKVIYLSPQGKKLCQNTAQKLVSHSSLILICGRYEGVDERLIQQEVDEEYSIGDYILSGGELPAMVCIDVLARLVPEVVGDQSSVNEDSLSCGLLKYPQFTKPPVFAGSEVPKVLFSGHHEQIRRWRLKQSLGRTWQKRPDLLLKKTLSAEEWDLLTEYIEEFSKIDSKSP